MKKLIIKNLCKLYGSQSVFADINQIYEAGKIHGIIGDNGAGKSTLLNCIAGNISYKGKIIKHEISSVGILYAEPFMFPRITGEEFICFCLTAKKCKYDKQKLMSLNTLFQLPLNKYAENYSTGMLKKLHLLALFLQNNDLLLLDEPFNGLDLYSSAYVVELLKQINKSGTIIIISSHALQQLARFCDTISLIKNKSMRFFDSNFDDIISKIETDAAQKIKTILK